MNNELYSSALTDTLNEAQGIYPDIKNSFIFTKDSEILAHDKNTPEKNVVRAIDSFDSILEKADKINGINNITLRSSKGTVTISNIDDLYLVTVTSTTVDKSDSVNLTHILVSTILKLLEKISPTPLKNQFPKPESEYSPPISEQPIEETLKKQVDEEPLNALKPAAQPKISGLLVNQLMVENVKGIFVSADTVHVGNDIFAEWQEQYRTHKIEKVEVETFTGKTVQCKVKTIKNSRQEGKGIIQIPQKIQSILDTKKGELVKVKPIIYVKEEDQDNGQEQED